MVVSNTLNEKTLMETGCAGLLLLKSRRPLSSDDEGLVNNTHAMATQKRLPANRKDDDLATLTIDRALDSVGGDPI